MPQMAPLNWLSLMIMFILILLMFTILNFYSFNPNKPQTDHSSESTKTNWKW